MGLLNFLAKLLKCDSDSVNISAGGGDASWSKEEFIFKYGKKRYEEQMERQYESKKPYDERKEKYK